LRKGNGEIKAESGAVELDNATPFISTMELTHSTRRSAHCSFEEEKWRGIWREFIGTMVGVAGRCEGRRWGGEGIGVSAYKGVVECMDEVFRKVLDRKGKEEDVVEEKVREDVEKAMEELKNIVHGFMVGTLVVGEGGEGEFKIRKISGNKAKEIECLARVMR